MGVFFEIPGNENQQCKFVSFNTDDLGRRFLARSVDAASASQHNRYRKSVSMQLTVAEQDRARELVIRKLLMEA